MPNALPLETPINREILNNIETIFVVENIYVKQNGVIQSIIRKMKFMEDAWSYKPLIVVAEYNIDLNRIHNMLEYADYSNDQTFLNKGSHVLGVYDYFQKSYRDDLDVVEYTHEEGMIYKEIGNNVYSVFDGLRPVRIEHYTGFKNRLRLVDRFDSNGKKTKSVFYDDCGCVSKIRVYDQDNQKHYPYEYYYTTYRKLCIKAEYRYDNTKDEKYSPDKNVIEKLFVYDDEGNIVKECAHNAELAALCIEQILTDPDKHYLILDESGTYTRTVATLEKRNVSRVIVVHSAFLENASNLKSNPQPYYKHMCENHTRFEGIVFLTQAERKDFIKLYGDFRNTFVIPHPYPNRIVKSDFEERDHKKAVIVSRFDPIKRIDYAIDIFKLVVEELPDVKLEIYGFGRNEKEYLKQIDKLGLKDHVFIKGFTMDPAGVFRGAALSIMTSAAEGFGLTLAESVCNGCPPFAFDIKYGPSDIIKDGETGYLFPFKDNKAFAEKIVAFFQNIDLQRQFSENCYNDAPRFSKEVFLDKWYALMETMYRRNR